MKLFSRRRSAPAPDQANAARIIVAGGYEPDTVVVAAGEPASLVFHRRDHSPCSEDVVFPGLGVRVGLVQGQDVLVELPASAPGEYEFRCGMGMLRGRLVVR